MDAEFKQLLAQARNWEKVQKLKSTHEQENKFHKASTERSLKEIAQMKKTPMNYEEEYRRHKMMLKVCAELDRNPQVTQENWGQYYEEAMERKIEA